MGSRFRRVWLLRKGYDVEAVDGFFARSLDVRSGDAVGDRPVAGSRVSPQQVRLVAFGLVRHGYDVAQVDDALDELEDQLARRARDRVVATRGQQGLNDLLQAMAESLQGRLDRPSGRRFRRGDGLDHTYDPADVDSLCDQLSAYLSDGTRMSVDQVRRAVFRGRRGRRGYREADVDAFLDRAVAIMVAVD